MASGIVGVGGGTGGGGDQACPILLRATNLCFILPEKLSFFIWSCRRRPYLIRSQF